MTRIAASVLLLAQIALGSAVVGGCAGSQQPVSTAGPPGRSGSPSSEAGIDHSSEAAFTSAIHAILAKRDSDGHWSIRGPLQLANAQGIVVNLGRLWAQCQNAATTCDAEVAHFTDEVLKISTRSAVPTATSQVLLAVVRPASYLQQVPSEVRSTTLSEPLTANLLVIYVIDEGRAVRGAKAADLSAAGVSRDALPTTARLNLTAALPVRPEQRSCEPRSVAVWASGNYFESSRLLLGDFWQELGDRGHKPIFVAVPAAEALVVACDPDQAQLRELAGFVDRMSTKGQVPLSRALLKWTATGWQEVRP
jgi:uncharacterized protein YtpQ (UPF0354 family)